VTGDEEGVRDPRDGHEVLAHWDYVYDFDGDIGGFVTGQFLLRDDGVLWIRNGGSRWSGGRTWYEYRLWNRWTLEPGPFDVAGALAAVSRRHYTVSAPGPTPIDVSGS
jgi:hypothetical protein